ncbi:MAG: hypothetical protein A2293_15275 [Elusimicrobia bacterium RIFOXYB2_FULL_49_7]|nr:MAG: hypothetical protein A2293_15275 [Elusimicrobia bacterium RIFOXYB2_FULL_49_7]
MHEWGEIDRMAASIVALLKDRQLRETMGEKGCASVRERFDPTNLTRQFMSLLLDAAKKRKASLCIAPPKAPTIDRLMHLSSSAFSLLRALQYEQIKGIKLSGKTLDVGGGQYNTYYDLLNIDGDIESVNIDEKYKPTIIADLNNPLSVSSETYDNVLCFNTLEHIYKDSLAVKEMLRILKSGGTFYITVPFLFKIHGSPHDYHRHTHSWWQALMTDCGIKEYNLVIKPLVWGTCSSAYSFTRFPRLQSIQKKCVMLIDWMLYKCGIAKPSDYMNNALGYFIYGTK